MGGYVARKGESRNALKILVGKPEGSDHLEDLGVGGRIISKVNQNKAVEGVNCINLLRIGSCGGFL
jgi:hypothetical protein